MVQEHITIITMLPSMKYCWKSPEIGVCWKSGKIAEKGRCAKNKIFSRKRLRKEGKQVETNPNILLIMTDQQRHDSLGCYGFKGIDTPNLDKLAREGVLFENCYVNNPICTPSRASIFTGKQLPGHGVYRLNDILPDNEVMFTKHLQDKGYQTALIGKLHVSAARYEVENRNKNDGFDTYDWCHEPALFLDGKYNSYSKWLKKNNPNFYEKLKKHGRGLKNVPSDVHATKWTADRTIEHIKNRKKNIPFCCVMSIFDPHNPYTDYPVEMEKRIKTEHMEKSKYQSGETHGKPSGIVREHEHSYLGSFHDYSKKEIEDMRKGYYASVAFIDKNVGRVLDFIEKEGLKEDTVVIFISDHGDMLGDHELLVKGAFFYDACTKVPMIIRYPRKIKPDQRSKMLVQPSDIAATVLAQAGFAKDFIKKNMSDSIDLTEAIKNPREDAREYVLCLYRGSGICDSKDYFDPPINATMLRNRRYKLNIYHNFEEGRTELNDGELFDMINDPEERINLYDNKEYSQIKSELMSKLLSWMVNTDNKINCSRGGNSKTVNSTVL